MYNALLKTGLTIGSITDIVKDAKTNRCEQSRSHA